MATGTAVPPLKMPDPPAGVKQDAQPTQQELQPQPQAEPVKLNDPFADLASFIKPEPGDTPSPEPTKEVTPEPEKPPAEPPAGIPEPSTLKAPEKPTVSVKKPVPEPAQKPEQKLPADFRKGYDELKRKYQELEAQHARLKDDPEKKSLAEKLAEREKRIQQLDETVRFSAWERSEEFNEKYEKPFIETYNASRARIAQMKVNTEDGEPRQGTPEDFDRIMAASDPDQAAALIEEMFGTGAKAATVANLRERVIEANERKYAALDDYRKNLSERQKADLEKVKTEQAENAQLWQALNQNAVETHPEWFAPKEDDDKWNELLQKGFERADMAFIGNGNKLSRKEIVALHSQVRNQAAAFGPLVYRNRQLEARIQELEKELEQFKTSEPGAGQGDGSPAPTGEGAGNLYDDLDTIAKPGMF